MRAPVWACQDGQCVIVVIGQRVTCGFLEPIAVTFIIMVRPAQLCQALPRVITSLSFWIWMLEPCLLPRTMRSVVVKPSSLADLLQEVLYLELATFFVFCRIV